MVAVLAPDRETRQSRIVSGPSAFHPHAQDLHGLRPPHRGAIDGLLATGTSAGRVAARFSLGPDAVERHARNHVSRSVQAVRAALAPPREEIIPPVRLDGLLTVQGVAQRLAAR